MDIAVKNKKTSMSHGLKKRPVVVAVIGCALVGIGMASGFALSRGQYASNVETVDLPLVQSHDWIDDLCATFRVFGRKYQPLVDIGSDDPQAVSELINRTTGLQVEVPTFAETQQLFEGARIVVIDRTPGVELFYRTSAGELVSIFILARPQSINNPLTEVTETIRDNLSVAWWQGEQALFAVVGPSSNASLTDMAQSAYLKL
ncbi:hypothetical protein EDC90_100125 [Martelella mediterranea]|uniref:Uncharacterized protein n=2 Tax=Martelella mediterranea TaxID=293089 RepID=A0A4R3P2G2_9HYPH|nr:hypothetical protein EDC90_100125 [Martelella mediterranea]